MAITFSKESTSFRLHDIKKIRAWLLFIIQKEDHSSGDIHFILCSDDYLLEINKNYLNHDYYTDTITFDYCEDNNGLIAGDIFISVDRTADNAKTYQSNKTDELHRVMCHSLLHLLGYKDKSPSDKLKMTQKEDFYLSLRKNFF